MYVTFLAPRIVPPNEVIVKRNVRFTKLDNQLPAIEMLLWSCRRMQRTCCVWTALRLLTRSTSTCQNHRATEVQALTSTRYAFQWGISLNNILFIYLFHFAQWASSRKTKAECATILPPNINKSSLFLEPFEQLKQIKKSVLIQNTCIWTVMWRALATADAEHPEDKWKTRLARPIASHLLGDEGWG